MFRSMAVIHSSYYAMFHAARGVLFQAIGNAPKRHDRVIQQFGLLVRDLDDALRAVGKAFNHAKDERTAADYDEADRAIIRGGARCIAGGCRLACRLRCPLRVPPVFMMRHAIMLPRRRFLAASAAALAAPGIARAQSSRLLKFIPQSDLAVLDPVWTAAYVTRNHGMMVFDTLYGMDGAYQIQPQMADGHRVEDDGKTWLITLRDGLAWHDGEKVLARDCVASIRRWGARDSFGQTLMAVTDALDAPDDRTIRFRLKRPFPLLTAALGKPGSNICAMMPERLANTDPFKQVTRDDRQRPVPLHRQGSRPRLADRV